MGYDVNCCGIPHFHRKVTKMLWVMIITGFLNILVALFMVVYGDD